MPRTLPLNVIATILDTVRQFVLSLIIGKTMRGNFSLASGSFLPICIFFFCFATTGQLSSQETYTPNHPAVKNMVDRALKGLESINSGKAAGRRTFLALTIVEAAKRYEAEVPANDSRVTDAVEVIQRDIEAGKFDFYNERHERELYYPALAVILLCDLGVETYSKEIGTIVEFILERQTSSGGFAYRRNVHPGSGAQHNGDTSQTQFVWLALWVARSRGISINDQAASQTLKWLLDTNLNSGTWGYLYETQQPVATPNTLSIHLAALSTVYLLADFLNLSPRIAKSSADKAIDDIALPPSVSVFKGERKGSDSGGRPKVKLSNGQVRGTKARGNQYLRSNFSVQLESNSNYYLFAFERYAYFRELSEGSVRDIPDWYDQAVEHYLATQLDSGTFPKSGSVESEFVATCFAILFLVRSTEVLVPPPGQGSLNGGTSLAENTELNLKNGKLVANSPVQGLDDVLSLLDNDDINQQQFELVQRSLAKSVSQLTADKSKTRRQHLAFMRGLVSERNFYKRLIAVKLLARQQDMDNVPALIYALGDPNEKICAEAHNGLRLISRKLDSIKAPPNPTLADYQLLKTEWTNWFLKIRPGAELLD